MAGKRDLYAREVLRAGRDLGITRAGIIIGFATVYTECDWRLLANRADPETLNYPHEGLGSDSKSSGLFQQQPPWWGTAAQRMDPYQSAMLFFTALAKLDYNSGSHSPGWYAQQVQRSSFPDRYDTRIAEATALYDHITAQADTEGSTAMPQYTFTEDDRTGYAINRSSRHGARPWLFALHTEEGNGTAESLWNYFRGGAPVSYHYTLRDGKLIAVVDTDYAAWAALDANPYTLHLCFAGSRASWSREQWMARSGDIDIAAQVAVRDCLQYDIAVQVLGRDYAAIGRRVPGIADHSGITYGLGIGNHTDVGENFPWDYFEERVMHWVRGGGAVVPEVPLVNAIDTEAEENPWLGERITAGEGEAVNGGRYAHFAGGSVYWHPSTGAWAIPAEIMEPYEALGWEQSYVGYPIGESTRLPEGWVQGFQGGAIYRKNGYGGHVVTGMIRAFWDRSGFEDGRFGWPVSDEIWSDDTGTVRYQNFEGGRITWSATGTVGTHERPGFDDITTEEV